MQRTPEGPDSVAGNPESLLTLQEFAARARVDRDTVSRLAVRGRIPGAYSFGARWRFSWEVFLRDGGIRPVEVPPTPRGRRLPLSVTNADLDRLLSRAAE